MQFLDRLLHDSPLYSRAQCLARPCPIPNESGVYAWFFSDIPSIVPVDDTLRREGRRLLYVGISPKPPTKVGGKSRQTIRTRIRYHFRGNAEGSTLRKTLGVLLASRLGIRLQIVGSSGTRRTFNEGEAKLSAWMEENARVCWLPHPQPWEVEDAAIESLSLPLNLKGNAEHPFHAKLTDLRLQAKVAATR